MRFSVKNRSIFLQVYLYKNFSDKYILNPSMNNKQTQTVQLMIHKLHTQNEWEMCRVQQTK